MKIAVLGSDGQLGRELCRQLGSRCLPLSRDHLDITDRRLVLRMLLEQAPQAVINAAAFTQVDLAETQAERCQAVNADAVAHLAEVCQILGSPLVQVSTDYVFGRHDRRVPNKEEDPPEPHSVYASSKLEGERQAAQCPAHFIVRTCGLYGSPARQPDFVEKIIARARERPLLRVVDDQHCTPTYVPHLARAILFLLDTVAYGAYHIVNSGETTWYEFACEILAQTKMDVEVERISTAQLGAPAARPAYSVLDTARYHALGGPAMPHWRDALAEHLATRRC
jgi:dTDP-4-dehydrorhamnose reductase